MPMSTRKELICQLDTDTNLNKMFEACKNKWSLIILQVVKWKGHKSYYSVIRPYHHDSFEIIKLNGTHGGHISSTPRIRDSFPRFQKLRYDESQVISKFVNDRIDSDFLMFFFSYFSHRRGKAPHFRSMYCCSIMS